VEPDTERLSDSSDAAMDMDEDDCEDCSEPPKDFYQLLNVRQDATGQEIKAGYRKLAKSCHPDIAGQEASEVSILVTFAYKTLSDPTLRRTYDTQLKNYVRHFGDGYTGRPLSKWLRDDPEKAAGDQRGIFVDESLCIGCLACVNAAPETFHLHDEWGRARVHTQWGNDKEDTQVAISSCPADCIHYVQKSHLPVLEWCMRKAKMVAIPSMMEGTSSEKGDDPFDLAKTFIRKGEEQRARLRAEGISSPSFTSEEWAWGQSDPQIAFSMDMKRAWSKIKKKTKLAWTELRTPRKVAKNRLINEGIIGWSPSR
jgi:curved DNA-binding protein CbpA